MHYEHDLEAEIEKARLVFGSLGPEIQRDRILSGLLAGFGAEIKKTGALLQAHGAAAACAKCSLVLDGSCCFSGAEKWYDCNLILINLLLGVRIPIILHSGREQCRFAGPQGCVLKARYSICLGFFCLDLQNELGPARLAELRRQIGAEINSGWNLELALTAWLKAHPLAA